MIISIILLITFGCATVPKGIDYADLTAGLTKRYVELAQSEYAGPEYVRDGVLTDEGKRVLSEILLRAAVDRDELAVALGENEALKEIAKELSKEQWKQFLRGMGTGVGISVIMILILMLISDGGSCPGVA